MGSSQVIAERKFWYSKKGDSLRQELTIQIEAPRPACKAGAVEFDLGTAVCTVRFIGLDNRVLDVYGADSLQAVQLAANIDPSLRKLAEKYDLFFYDGEPYEE